MAKLEIPKKYIDETIQSAIDDIKQNFIPKSVLEEIKTEIEESAYFDCIVKDNNDEIRWATVDLKDVIEIIDKYIKNDVTDINDGNIYEKESG